MAAPVAVRFAAIAFALVAAPASAVELLLDRVTATTPSGEMTLTLRFVTKP